MTQRQHRSACTQRQLPCRCFAVLAILFLCGSISKAQEPSDLELEKIALDALVTDYKLDNHVKDQDGYVIDVRLQGGRFDDAAIDHAVQFKKLHSLGVARSSITDAGIEKLQKLKYLRRLWMGFTEITDRGLGYLEKIPTLRQIWAWEANNLTDKGFDSLRKAVPALAINLGPQTNLPPFKNDPLYKNNPINNESRGGLAAILLVGLVITLSLALGLWVLRKRHPVEPASTADAAPTQVAKSKTSAD